MKITKSKRFYYWAWIIAYVVAWVACVLPALIAGVINLPIVAVKEAETTLTGSFIIVIAVCAYPIIKGVLKALKSPSAWLILWICTGLIFALYKVPHETLGAMCTVFFCAAIGNTVGAILFWLSKKFKQKYGFLINEFKVVQIAEGGA